MIVDGGMMMGKMVVMVFLDFGMESSKRNLVNLGGAGTGDVQLRVILHHPTRPFRFAWANLQALHYHRKSFGSNVC